MVAVATIIPYNIIQWVGTRHITLEFNDVRGNVRASRVKQLAGGERKTYCVPLRNGGKKKRKKQNIILYEYRHRLRLTTAGAKRVRRAHKRATRRATGKPTCPPRHPIVQLVIFGTDAVSVARVHHRASPRVLNLTYKYIPGDPPIQHTSHNYFLGKCLFLIFHE